MLLLVCLDKFIYLIQSTSLSDETDFMKHYSAFEFR